jgi:hypothetical protein
MDDSKRLSLSELLYRISLEPPGMWWMVFGPGLEIQPPYLNIGNLASFVLGYAGAATRDGFFIWLRDEADAFPQQGWAQHLLQAAGGDHQKAITRLFDYLHRYLLETRPDWFIRLNQEPQQSLFSNGLGTPRSLDVRNSDHVRALTGQIPTSPPETRVSGFEMGDGFNLVLGLPPGVESWWAGTGRRVVWVAHAAALDAVRGRREPANEILARAREAGGSGISVCVVDTSAHGAQVLCSGECGAIRVAQGSLLSVAQPGLASSWQMNPGDTVMILSKPLLDRALSVGIGPLPSSLATASPTAWAQSVESAGRRVAVAIAWAAV